MIRVTRNSGSGPAVDDIVVEDPVDEISVNQGHLFVGNENVPIAIYAPGIWQSALVVNDPKPEGKSLGKTGAAKKT